MRVLGQYIYFLEYNPLSYVVQNCIRPITATIEKVLLWIDVSDGTVGLL
jgi:hypothetical protein